MKKHHYKRSKFSYFKKQTSLKLLLKRSKYYVFENYFLKMGVVQQLLMLPAALLDFSNFVIINLRVLFCYKFRKVVEGFYNLKNHLLKLG